MQKRKMIETSKLQKPTYHRMLLSDKNAIADAQILDQVAHRVVHIEANLEMAASMLLSCLLVLVWDDEIIDDALYSCAFLIQIALMLFDTLLAAKVDATVAQILFLAVYGAAHGNSLHVDLAIFARICSAERVLRTSSLRLMADKAKCIDLNLFTFHKSG